MKVQNSLEDSYLHKLASTTKGRMQAIHKSNGDVTDNEIHHT